MTLGVTRELTELEKEIVRTMASGHKMISTDYHVFVNGRRTNRLLLSRLRDIGLIEAEDEFEKGVQHWVLSKKGKAWAKTNPL